MSQLVAFTFGSFGDIFTLLGLARSVQQLLSARNGASAECQELVEYLNTFSRTLRVVQKLAFGPDVDPATAQADCTSNTGTAPLLSSPEYRPAANAVLHALQECRRSLDLFKDKLAPYQESLLASGSGNKFYDIWRKLSWTSISDEAMKLRRGLQEQVLLINTITTMLILHASTPAQSPSRGLPSGVYLTDILNVQLLVPTEWCRDPMEFHEYLRFYFTRKNRKGKTFVMRQKYSLKLDASHKLLGPGAWAGHVEAGTHILMDALVEQDEDRDPCVCPTCHTENRVCGLHNVNTDDETQCSSCGTIFKVAAFLQPPSQVVIPTTQLNESFLASVASTPSSAAPQDIEEELSFIRRISLVPAWSKRRNGMGLKTIGSTFPEIAKSERNIEVLTAWRNITSNPQFKDVDINELCSEFTRRARCDGTKVVLDPEGVQDIFNFFSASKSRQPLASMSALPHGFSTDWTGYPHSSAAATPPA